MARERQNDRTTKPGGTDVRYLVLADDLTGALDTGLQLRRLGIPTKVLAGESVMTELFREEGIPALVINTDSRHTDPDSAYRIVRDICQKASGYQIQLIYKKTDSVLRGNIGAELEAIADVGYKTIYFAPAYPKLDRTTVDGRQLIQQVPVDQSPFGRDQLNPIQTASVPDLLAQAGLEAVVISQETDLESLRGREGIFVFDAETDERLEKVAEWIAGQSGKFALAGCAGFAEHLRPILHYERSAAEPETVTYDGVIVISGSLNPLSFTQIQTAARAGFDVISVEGFDGFLSQDDFEMTEGIVRKILDAYARNPKLIIETTSKGADSGDMGEKLRAGKRIANHFGKLVKEIRENGFDGLFVVSGGDTLGSIVKHIGGHSIEPIREIEPGVVLANVSTDDGVCQFITKSGGIGSAEIYCLIKDIFVH